MKKVWYIYLNNNNIGVVMKLNEVFKRIELVAGKHLTNWDVLPDKVRVIDGIDIYEGRHEEIH